MGYHENARPPSHILAPIFKRYKIRRDTRTLSGARTFNVPLPPLFEAKTTGQKEPTPLFSPLKNPVTILVTIRIKYRHLKVMEKLGQVAVVTVVTMFCMHFLVIPIIVVAKFSI
jgi:hypothetical protein